MCHIVRLVLFFLCLCAAPALASDRLTFSSGGIARFPNSQQEDDTGNAMIEAWAKANYAFGPQGLSFFLRGKFISDSVQYDYNNAQTLGVGLAYKLKTGKDSSLTFTLRHDWYERYHSGSHEKGWRFLIDYFYIDFQKVDAGARMWGLPHDATLFKIWANLTYPDTLSDGDHNIVVTSGAEYAARLDLPGNKWQLSPFVALNLSWDKDDNSYNNKLQPGLGVKLRWPLPGGDIHAGVRYRGDYRWGSGSFEHGPGLFVGWYSSF